MKLHACFAAVLALLTAPAGAQSLADFAALPEVFQPQVSADGRYLAVGCRADYRSRVCVYDLSDGSGPELYGLPAELRLDRFYFAGPRHLVIDGWFFEDPREISGDEKFEFRRALSFNLETGQSAQLMGNYGSVLDTRGVISLDASDPDSVLVEIVLRAGGGDVTGSQLRSQERLYSVLFRVDLDTGEGEREDTGILWRRLITPEGEVSGEILFDPEDFDYEVRRVAGGRETLYTGVHAADWPWFNGFTEAGDYVFTFPTGEHRGVRRMDPRTGELTALTPLTDGVTLRPVIDPARQVVVGVRGLQDDLPIQVFMDETLAGDVAALAGALQVDRVILNSWSDDRSVVVFETVTAGRPGQFFLYDRNAGGVSPIGQARPALAQAELGAVSAFQYEASDGLEIPAILTLPAGGARDGGPYPLVVMPHGGPQANDTLQFDWWAQAFAAEGYLVLQPNFRGSDGYGQAFIEAGYGEFGGRMIEDMLDGAQALRDAGLAQPGPACFAGASYGGYAALMAALTAPGDVACAVAVAPVTNPLAMLGDRARDRDRTSLAYWEQYIGDRFMDPEAATAISPLRRAGELAVPTLVIHGDADSVVPVDQSRSLASALQERASFDYVEINGGDHSLSQSSDRRLVLERGIDLVNEALR